MLEDGHDTSDRSVRLSSSEMMLPVVMVATVEVASGLPSGLVTPSVTDGSSDSLEGWLKADWQRNGKIYDIAEYVILDMNIKLRD